MMWTVVIIAIGVVFVAGIAVTVLSMSGNRNRNGVHNNKRRIVTDGGVSTKKLTYGKEIGSFFEPAMQDYGTVMHGGSKNRMWEADLEILGTGRRQKIFFRHKMAIGRKKEDMMQYPNLEINEDKLISGIHCLLIGGQGCLMIQDEGSLNHTYLNEKRVDSLTVIPNGSIIRVGKTHIKIQYKCH